ncbi:hypothetical protein ACKKBF_B31790 [Auxenochlorella protothecoides x Auxenochlorella symbiontica]
MLSKRPTARPDATLFPAAACQLAEIRGILKVFPIPEDDGPRPDLPDKQAWTGAALSQIDDLHTLGFTQSQCLEAVTATGTLDRDALIEWLLLHLAPKDIPRVFALQSASESGDVAVLRKADPAARESACALGAMAREAPEPRGPALQELKAEAAAHEPASDQKAWILQHLEAAGSSSGDSDDSRSRSSSSSVEDWEVWGAPEEVAARRAQRSRAEQLGALSRGELAAQLGRELQEALRAGAKAKGSRDSAGQRTAGEAIRRVKAEIAAFALSPEELDAGARPASPDPVAKGVEIGTPPSAQHPAVPPEDDWVVLGEDSGSEASGAEDKVEPGPKAPFQAAPQAAPESRPPQDEPVFDLFGEVGDEAGKEPMPRRQGQPPSRLLASLPPPPVPQRGAKGGAKAQAAPAKRGANAQAASGGPLVQTPKQALARYCQSQGLAAPRYEKLQAGGGRNDGEGGIRYSVTLEQLLPGKPTPKKVTTRCQLAVFEDGWDTIEEAQHAVATRALYLTTPESLGLWQKLPPDHREMWFQWVDRADAGLDTLNLGDEEELSNLQARLESVYSDLHAQERARRLADAVPGEGGPSTRGGSSRSQLPNPEWVARESARLRRQRADWLASDAGRAWASRRAQLPIHPLGPRLTAALEAGDVAIVASETGSGKTTQVPQFLLDAAIDLHRGTATSVVCTQPRRIAATSVAARVAAERGEAAPGQPGGQVGYQVRFDSAMTASTRILFCTTGILLRRLASDPQLESVSHVVVDEVHERSMEGDFLMALLRDMAAARRAAGRPLKLVLMSATLDFGALSEYFGGAPVLSSPGRTFPVTQRYLEDAYEATGYALAEDSHCALRAGSDAALRARQAAIRRAAAGSQGVLAQGWGDDGARPGAVLNPHYHPGLYGHLSPVTIRNLKRVDEEALDLDLAEALVEHIAEKGAAGAILVFLPGMAEISALQDRLARESVDRAPGSRLVLPLHSSTPADEQRLAFRPAPEGTRKIVLATNIAETSVTIEDVVHVVDCGRLNERRYDAAARTSVLARAWVSRASAAQRRGRAGRVRPGEAWALYTRDRAERRLRAHQAPEMERVPLEELVLTVHTLGLGPAAGMLARVLQPPPARSVDAALRTLRDIGALGADERLLPLGAALGALPLDARVARVLLVGLAAGCAAPAASAAACLAHAAPWLEAGAAAAAAAAASGLALAAGRQSDHLAAAAALGEWVREGATRGPGAAAALARRRRLAPPTLRALGELRAQYAALLADLGWAPRSAARRDRATWLDDAAAPWNRHARKPAVVAAALAWALKPALAVAEPPGTAESGARPQWRDVSGEVAVHPSSVIHPLTHTTLHHPFVTFLDKMRTSRTFLRDCTVVSPLAVLLFGDGLRLHPEVGAATLDGDIRIRVPAVTGALVKQLRLGLEAMLSSMAGRRDKAPTPAELALVDAAAMLLQAEDGARSWG